jgi:hypothetical protein
VVQERGRPADGSWIRYAAAGARASVRVLLPSHRARLRQRASAGWGFRGNKPGEGVRGARQPGQVRCIVGSEAMAAAQALPVYIVVGPKGTGKSYLCGLLAGNPDAFPRGDARTHVTTAQRMVHCDRGIVVDTTGLDLEGSNRPNFNVCRGHRTYVILLVNDERITTAVTQLLRSCGLARIATPAQVNVFNGYRWDGTGLPVRDRGQLLDLVDRGQLQSFLMPVLPPAAGGQAPQARANAAPPPRRLDPMSGQPVRQVTPDAAQRSFREELASLTAQELETYRRPGDSTLRLSALMLNINNQDIVEQQLTNEHMAHVLATIVEPAVLRVQLERLFPGQGAELGVERRGDVFEATCFRMRYGGGATSISRRAFSRIVELLLEPA